MIVRLTAVELAVLDRQRPSTRSHGGWQGLIVSLQERVDRATGTLVLTARDLERIARYAFDYGNGGWEGRLRMIFSRSLGSGLGRQRRAA